MHKRCLVGFLLLTLTACDEGYSGPTDIPDFADTDGDGKLRIVEASGGNLFLTEARLEALRAEGVRIEVDGPCSSACTLVLSERYDNACWTDKAVFRFHGATMPSLEEPGEYIESFILTFGLWRKLPTYVQGRLPPPEEWRSDVWFELTAGDLGKVRHCNHLHTAAAE